MNKFELMNLVLTSTLKKEPKLLLIELIIRANSDWECWPSVERLCQVIGIAHEKNFKGVEHYLPGLVTKQKRGRKNLYSINTPAVEGLLQAKVTIKHTPALEGVSTDTPAVEGAYTPAVADNTPAVADNTPAVEGANSTSNTTQIVQSILHAPEAHSSGKPSSSKNRIRLDKETLRANLIGRNTLEPPLNREDTLEEDTPAVEGVSEVDLEFVAFLAGK